VCARARAYVRAYAAYSVSRRRFSPYAAYSRKMHLIYSSPQATLLHSALPSPAHISRPPPPPLTSYTPICPSYKVSSRFSPKGSAHGKYLLISRRSAALVLVFPMHGETPPAIYNSSKPLGIELSHRVATHLGLLFIRIRHVGLARTCPHLCLSFAYYLPLNQLIRLLSFMIWIGKKSFAADGRKLLDRSVRDSMQSCWKHHGKRTTCFLCSGDLRCWHESRVISVILI